MPKKSKIHQLKVSDPLNMNELMYNLIVRLIYKLSISIDSCKKIEFRSIAILLDNAIKSLN